MSEKFKYLVPEEVAIEGRIDSEQLVELKKSFKSCVYLAGDSESDRAVEGGIASYAPEIAVTHLPVSPGTPNGLTLDLAEKIAQAVDQAEKPVLVQCTGAVRASAGAMFYLALKNGWGVAECLEFATANSLGFMNMAKLKAWVEQSVPYLGKPHSAKIRYLEEGLAIDGSIDMEMLEVHKAVGFKSFIYLCTDVDADRALPAPAGFPELAEAFPESRHHPVNMGEELTVELAQSIVSDIESLPRPLLVQCRGSNRASAPVLMYLAKKNQWSVANAESFTESWQLPYTSSGKLKEWTNTFVSSLHDGGALAS
eukprot:CAMPEP_0117757742 /NCGR_PEP_ID=MMETSP0947-20121206/14926_1 /TAXON_ID=44440 /ORGANISM="Chattonella subsalsa, Strain CCMP2191" /LENGTH=310 /DNA_ID=CAMNT_0005577721 /DNA_START=134 /DNA_END=1066 /DNA_ORIENTATION=-